MNRLLRNKRGETLTETIVSTLILTIVMATVAIIVTSSTNMVNDSSKAYENMHDVMRQIDNAEFDAISDKAEVDAKFTLEFSVGGSTTPTEYTIDSSKAIFVTPEGLTYTN